MIKRIIGCLVSISIIAAMFVSCSPENKDTSQTKGELLIPGTTQNELTKTDEFRKVAENEHLTLYINDNTADFKVVNKKDGKEYISTPKSDKADTKNAMFDISYLDSKGSIVPMNSFDDSVKKGQYKVEEITNGVKIKYSLGNIAEKLYVPTAIEASRFEAILEKISSRFDKSLIKAQYYLVELDAVEDAKTQADLQKKFPALKKQNLYVLKQDTLALNVQRDINRVLVSTGYNDEDYEIDLKNSDISQSNVYPAVNVAVEISLKGDKVNVSIPMKEVEEFNGASIINISLLKNFGSPLKGEGGKFLLPDGSGSIMQTYNGKSDLQIYQVPVYGRDKSVPFDEKIFADSKAYLPVFAKLYNDSAMLAIIEDGDSLCEVMASPGDDSNYASAYTMFRIRELSKTYLSSSSKEQGDYFYVAQGKPYDGNLSVSFKLFDNENKEVSDLADYYSQLLFGDKKTDEGANINVEFIGAAQKQSSFLGIKTKEMIAFTTIKDVIEIGNDLISQGVDNLVFNLKGFFKGGYDNGYSKNLKLENKVGTQEDLENLLSWGKQNNVEIYFDVESQYVYKNTLTDGFSLATNVSKLITKDVGIDYPYDKPSYQRDVLNSQKKYIVNPMTVSQSLSNISTSLKSLKIPNVSLRNVGNDLNSTFNEKKPFERQNAQKLMVDSLKTNQFNSIYTSGANAYVLPYANHVTDIAIKTCQSDINDGVTAFLPMVLNSRVDYSGIAVNMSANTPKEYLKDMAVGAGFKYVITASESEIFKNTQHEEFYSTQYSIWKQDIIKKSKLLKDSKATVKSGLVSEQELDQDVFKYTYKNGESIIVNLSQKEYKNNDLTVEKNSYIKMKAGE